MSLVKAFAIEIVLNAKDAKEAISINLAALRRLRRLRYFEIVLARMPCPVSVFACNSKSRPWG